MRDPNSIKQQLIKAHFAGNPQPQETQESADEPQGTHPRTDDRAPHVTPEPEREYAPSVRSRPILTANTIAGAAAQDIQDMEGALYNARRILGVGMQSSRTSLPYSTASQPQGFCRKNDRVGRLIFLSSHPKWLLNPCSSGVTFCQRSSCWMCGGIVVIP